MHRRFIAIIVASAIAVTAAAVSPAAAGSKERDLARIAAGVLGVAIIGKLIHDNNKRQEARQPCAGLPCSACRSAPRSSSTEAPETSRWYGQPYRQSH